MASPIKGGRITFPYKAKYANGDIHKGVDYAVKSGTPVYACVAGKVVHAGNHLDGGWTNRGWGTAFGTHVVVDNAAFADGTPGYWTGYCHLSKVSVKLGDRIKKGQIIGYSGQSGNVTGPHLHLQILTKRYWDRTAHLNPDKWIKA